MNYVKSLNILGTEATQIPCQTGKGAPGTDTEAAVGCLYMDTITGALYKCVAAMNGMFIWKEAEGKDGSDEEEGMENLTSIEGVMETKVNYFDPSMAVAGQIYKLNEDKVTIGLVDGYATMAGGIIEANPEKTYLLSRSDYTVYLVDEDMAVLGSFYTEASGVLVNIAEVAGDNYQKVRYLAFSWKVAACAIDEFMVVDEATGLGNYISYKAPYVMLRVATISRNNKIYHVGPGREYTTLTECLLALKGDESEKTIYMDAGEYDIFQEIGGANFCATIAAGTNWRDVSVIVPDNTSIIGLGEVILKFQPAIEEIGAVAAGLLSPLNIADNAVIENITINSYNCRYAIHSDLLHWEGTDRVGLKQVYRNVRINHQYKDAGNTSGFGCGHWQDGVYIFEHCRFHAYLPVGIHNNGTYTTDATQLIFNNCVFESTYPATYPCVRLGNVNANQTHVRVEFNGCYLNGKIRVQNESSAEVPNAFDITMVRSSEVECEIVSATNIYEPKIYS